MSTNGVQAVSITKHFVKSRCKHEKVATALVAFWSFAVMERWYSLKSLACCRMLLSFSVMRASRSDCRLLRL
ncbi:hypothetical protein EYF80_031223 [Liparis tanakae]|uniref:Uncharacterized protein n=1 Tax=Liparis tanakae TaxID=230148 RepID=A0A4Z2H0K2_9TELE|nr:hypothetical protein EYF80_031223 [Liparis tanakae]